jgi:hypothetical protein
MCKMEALVPAPIPLPTRVRPVVTCCLAGRPSVRSLAELALWRIGLVPATHEKLACRLVTLIPRNELPREGVRENRLPEPHGARELNPRLSGGMVSDG